MWHFGSLHLSSVCYWAAPGSHLGSYDNSFSGVTDNWDMLASHWHLSKVLVETFFFPGVSEVWGQEFSGL